MIETPAYFNYGHLPEGPLRDVSKECHDLAVRMHERLPRNEEAAFGFRKLLEAKDCFVRSALDLLGE